MVDELREIVERVQRQPEAIQRRIIEMIQQALEQAQPDDALVSYAGAWSDLPEENEAEVLDRLRHESTPTPPIEEQLRWLDEE